MLRAFIFSAVMLLALVAMPQSREASGSAALNVTVIQDPRIEWLLQAHQEVAGAENGIPGFRIQVAVESGNQSRVRIQRRKYEFDEIFPELKSYINYDAPYFKLRVGDFRTRLDARRYLDRIAREYPTAFIVVDGINFPTME